MNGPNPFGNVAFMPGVGFVENPNQGKASNLGDDSAVMMISGLGQDAGAAPTQPKAPLATASLFDSLPWWGWFLLGMLTAFTLMKLLDKKKKE